MRLFGPQPSACVTRSRRPCGKLEKAFRLGELIKHISERIIASFPRDRILCIPWFRSGLFAQLRKRRLKFCEPAKQAVSLGKHADVLSEDPNRYRSLRRWTDRESEKVRQLSLVKSGWAAWFHCPPNGKQCLGLP